MGTAEAVALAAEPKPPSSEVLAVGGIVGAVAAVVAAPLPVVFPLLVAGAGAVEAAGAASIANGGG